MEELAMEDLVALVALVALVVLAVLVVWDLDLGDLEDLVDSEEVLLEGSEVDLEDMVTDLDLADLADLGKHGRWFRHHIILILYDQTIAL